MPSRVDRSAADPTSARSGVSRVTSITPRRAIAALLVAFVAFALAGCSGEPFAEGQRYGTGEQGYVAGDGSWQLFPEAERGAPAVFSGPTESGGTFDSSSLSGRVSVVNFWYAACPPCRAEAANLQSVYAAYQPQDVPFVGVNIYDQAPTAASFAQTFGVTYPSILDVGSNTALLAFANTVPQTAIPSTVVLDRQGRVAALIRGPIDVGTLSSMIDSTLAEAA